MDINARFLTKISFYRGDGELSYEVCTQAQLFRVFNVRGARAHLSAGWLFPGKVDPWTKDDSLCSERVKLERGHCKKIMVFLQYLSGPFQSARFLLDTREIRPGIGGGGGRGIFDEPLKEGMFKWGEFTPSKVRNLEKNRTQTNLFKPQKNNILSCNVFGLHCMDGSFELSPFKLIPAPPLPPH